MMIGECKKCGNIWVRAQYNKETDTMIFVCSCGYSWKAEPLQKEEAMNPTPDKKETKFSLMGHTHQFIDRWRCEMCRAYFDYQGHFMAPPDLPHFCPVCGLHRKEGVK